MKKIDYMSLNCGSTQPLITQSALGNVEVSLAPVEEMVMFAEQTEKITLLQNHLIHENNRLIELRDFLLPRLMSGEVDVSKLELSS